MFTYSLFVNSPPTSLPGACSSAAFLGPTPLLLGVTPLASFPGACPTLAAPLPGAASFVCGPFSETHLVVSTSTGTSTSGLRLERIQTSVTNNVIEQRHVCGKTEGRVG